MPRHSLTATSLNPDDWPPSKADLKILREHAYEVYEKMDTADQLRESITVLGKVLSRSLIDRYRGLDEDELQSLLYDREMNDTYLAKLLWKCWVMGSFGPCREFDGRAKYSVADLGPSVHTGRPSIFAILGRNSRVFEVNPYEEDLRNGYSLLATLGRHSRVREVDVDEYYSYGDNSSSDEASTDDSESDESQSLEGDSDRAETESSSSEEIEEVDEESDSDSDDPVLQNTPRRLVLHSDVESDGRQEGLRMGGYEDEGSDSVSSWASNTSAPTRRPPPPIRRGEVMRIPLLVESTSDTTPEDTMNLTMPEVIVCNQASTTGNETSGPPVHDTENEPSVTEVQVEPPHQELLSDGAPNIDLSDGDTTPEKVHGTTETPIRKSRVPKEDSLSHVPELTPDRIRAMPVRPAFMPANATSPRLGHPASVERLVLSVELVSRNDSSSSSASPSPGSGISPNMPGMWTAEEGSAERDVQQTRTKFLEIPSLIMDAWTNIFGDSTSANYEQIEAFNRNIEEAFRRSLSPGHSESVSDSFSEADDNSMSELRTSLDVDPPFKRPCLLFCGVRCQERRRTVSCVGLHPSELFMTCGHTSTFVHVSSDDGKRGLPLFSLDGVMIDS